MRTYALRGLKSNIANHKRKYRPAELGGKESVVLPTASSKNSFNLTSPLNLSQG